METNVKYIGLDVHKEHADFPIMPNTDRNHQFGWGSRGVQTRHNQRASRKSNSLSSGRYRAGLTPSDAVCESAFSFKRMSA